MCTLQPSFLTCKTPNRSRLGSSTITQSPNNCGKIIIMHQNMRSLKNKKVDLEYVLNLKQPDLICLTEHWLKHDEISCCQFNKFILAASYCRKTASGGGVCIYVRNNITFKVINLEKLCQDKVLEASCISISSLKLCIIAVYRSPISINLETFFKYFEKILVETKPLQRYQIICGDFNIDTNECDNVTNTFKNVLSQFNLKCTISEATRTTLTSKSTLDNIITNLNSKHYKSTNYVTALSDHDAQIMIIEKAIVGGNSMSTKTVKVSKKRKFNEDNIAYFNSLLQNETWYNVYTQSNPDLAWNEFLNIFSIIFEHTFPKVTVKEHSVHANKWMTNGLYVSYNKLRSLHTSKRNNQSETHRMYTKKYEKIYKKLIAEAKKLYNSKIINLSLNKSKQMWKLIKNEIKQGDNHINLSIKIRDNLINNPKLIANEFNKFFSTIPHTLINKACEHTNNSKTTQKGNTMSSIKNHKSMFFTPVSEDDITKIINNLKTKNSSGLDQIPITLIKKCCHSIKSPLTYIFNICLSEGTFPDRLKWAKILPIHKKGDATNMNNYRPIAILSSFSKILEKIIANQLVSFLGKYNIISQNQFGFMKGKSTEQAIYCFINKVISSLDKQQYVLGIFADLSKAFDCVDHNLLLTKLEAYGVRGVPLKMFESYLHNRLQVTLIRHSDSRGRLTEYISQQNPITIGVPQGSILGPLLFIIFINDFPLIIKKGEVVMFADDTNILVSDRDRTDLISNTNSTVNELSNWFQVNKLVLNTTKSTILQFTLSERTIQKDEIVPIGNKKLEILNAVRFLGLEIDKNLSWYTHTNAICKKLCTMCYAIHSVKKICTTQAIRALYFANVQSILEYGIIFWGNSSKSIKIFRLQKKIIRIIKGKDKLSHCRPLFKELNLMTFPSLYIYHTILFVMQNVNIKLNSEVHKHNTRGQSNLHVIGHRTNLFANSPQYSGIKLINKLPKNLKDIRDSKKFKHELKEYLIKNAFYSVDEYLGKSN